MLELETSKAVHWPEQNFKLARWFAYCIYIQNTLSPPITLAHSFSKPQTRVYIYLLKIELFLNSHYHALCTVVSFILFNFFHLTDTGYAPNFFSKQCLQWGLSLYLKISAFFFLPEITHLFHVQICQTKMIKTCLVSTVKALKTCQVVRSKFPQSDISVVFQLSPLCPIMSPHQLLHPNTDWCCYF